MDELGSRYPGTVCQDLENPFTPGKVWFIPRVTSTMDVASAAIKAGAPSGTVIHTGYQEQGRGRPDAEKGGWQSPAGCSLMMTLSLHASQFLEPCSLRVGLGLSRCIEENWRLPVRIKWPNDVYIYGRKVAGILVERSSGWLRIGIGLNLLGTFILNDSSVPKDKNPISIQEALEMDGRGDVGNIVPPLLSDHVLPSVLHYLSLAAADPGWQNSVQTRLLYRGQRVRIGAVEGVLRGINSQGMARIELDTGVVCPVGHGSLRLISFE